MIDAMQFDMTLILTEKVDSMDGYRLIQSSAKLCARAGTTTQFTRMTVNQWFDKAERSQRSPLGRSVDIGRAASALNSQHEHAEVPQDLTK